MRQYVSVDTYNGKVLSRELVDGKDVYNRVDFEPVLYIYTNGKDYGYRDFYDRKNITPVNFEKVFDMYEFVKENVGEKVYGSSNIVTQYINSESFDEPDLKSIVYSIIDIEVCSGKFDSDGVWHDGGFPVPELAEAPVTALCEYRSDDDMYYVYTTAKWDSDKSLLKYVDRVKYIYSEDEEGLLKSWMKNFRKRYPHVISGWNSKNFDIVYIVNRIKKVLGEDKVKLLSPWKVVEEKKSKAFTGEPISTYKIYGIQHLDYIDIYKKFLLKPREKYTLRYISDYELKDEHKLEFSGTHASLYYDDPQFFVDYNVQDVRCVRLFEKKFRFLNLSFMLGYMSGENFEDVLSPVKTWENILYKEYMVHGIVPPYPSKEKAEKSSYAGAYVFDVEPGLKNLIVSYDFASLYPSIMRQCYMGPDTIVKGDKRDKALEELKSVLRENGEDELLSQVEAGCINEYYIGHRHLPKCIGDFLRKNNYSMSTNVNFFDKGIKSYFVESITKLYKERKMNKKESFRHSENCLEIEKELEKRGIKY